MQEKTPLKPSAFRRYGALAVYLAVYAGWFACVLLGKYGYGVLSPVVPLLSAALFQAVFRYPRDEWQKAFILVLTGMFADNLAAAAGLLQLPASDDAALPLWLLSLWLLFAPALFLFKRLFGQRWWLAALAGAIGGPLAYTSGEHFGVLSLSGWLAIAAYALFWAVYLALAMRWLAPVKSATSA